VAWRNSRHLGKGSANFSADLFTYNNSPEEFEFTENGCVGLTTNSDRLDSSPVKKTEISIEPKAQATGRSGKAKSRKPGTASVEKSDAPKVLKKPSNNGTFPEEMVEGRGVAKGNAEQTSASRTQSRR
jgi:hypothetical protein